MDVQRTIRESYTIQSKQTEESSIVSNHLNIPKPMDINPNLLSPEVLGQRRGITLINFKSKNVYKTKRFYVQVVVVRVYYQLLKI